MIKIWNVWAVAGPGMDTNNDRRGREESQLGLHLVGV